MSVVIDSLLPLDIRLRKLEAQVYGMAEKTEARTEKSATQRLREIEEGLERLGESSDGVKRLVNCYHQYLPFLSIPIPTSSIMSTEDADESQVKESDILPDSVKLAMILEAAIDIKNADKYLREVDVLRNKGVEGSGQLEEILALKPNLVKAVEQNRQERIELGEARQAVGSLMTRYNDFTSTISELFVDLHHQMEAIEEDVLRLERKKRKELASRF
ncbi:hypothetical protein L204_104807 [Cryptococcus depauperatus]|nr:hypothetical protein L204_05311 [Cryptococcus depauperatus CBS 7855]